jgi:hypothetical protein
MAGISWGVPEKGRYTNTYTRVGQSVSADLSPTMSGNPLPLAAFERAV